MNNIVNKIIRFLFLKRRPKFVGINVQKYVFGILMTDTSLKIFNLVPIYIAHAIQNYWSMAVKLALGDLQLSAVTGKPVTSEAVPKPVQAEVKTDEASKPKPQAPSPQITKKLTADTTDMSYSVDSTASAFTVKITNKSTGEVIRKLDFKGFSPDVHQTSKLTGSLVDVKS